MWSYIRKDEGPADPAGRGAHPPHRGAHFGGRAQAEGVAASSSEPSYRAPSGQRGGVVTAAWTDEVSALGRSQAAAVAALAPAGRDGGGDAKKGSAPPPQSRSDRQGQGQIPRQTQPDRQTRPQTDTGGHPQTRETATQRQSGGSQRQLDTHQAATAKGTASEGEGSRDCPCPCWPPPAWAAGTQRWACLRVGWGWGTGAGAAGGWDAGPRCTALLCSQWALGPAVPRCASETLGSGGLDWLQGGDPRPHQRGPLFQLFLQPVLGHFGEAAAHPPGALCEDLDVPPAHRQGLLPLRDPPSCWPTTHATT